MICRFTPMPKPLPLPPTVQDYWLDKFAQVTQPVREFPQAADSWLRENLGAGNYSSVKRNVADIFNAPSPIGWEDDLIKGAVAIPYLVKNLGKSPNAKKALDLFRTKFQVDPLQGNKMVRN